MIPFDLEEMLKVPPSCNGCPGCDLHGVDEEKCERRKMSITETLDLHARVVAAEHEPTQDEIDRIDDAELCSTCEFEDAVCTFWGNYYEPPEYEGFCFAASVIHEECLCDGMFYKEKKNG
jgi:hypothetical protein